MKTKHRLAELSTELHKILNEDAEPSDTTFGFLGGHRRANLIVGLDVLDCMIRRIADDTEPQVMQ